MIDIYSLSDSISWKVKFIVLLALLLIPTLHTTAYLPIDQKIENDCLVVKKVVGKMVFPLNETTITPIKWSDLGKTYRTYAAGWPWGGIGKYSTSKHGPVLVFLRRNAKQGESLNMLEYGEKKYVLRLNQSILSTANKYNQNNEAEI